MMTADRMIEKIKAKILEISEPTHVRALMDIFKLREPVLQKCFLTRDQQIHLLKTNPPAWNTWWRFVFPGVLDTTGIEHLSPFIVHEIAVDVLIKLQDVDFSGCDLSPVHLGETADLSGCRFDNANLEGAYFDRCRFHGVSFKNANLRHANFKWCSVSDTSFDDADLSYAYGKSTFRGKVSFEGVRLKSTCLVIDYQGNDLVHGASDIPVRGRLVDDGASVKFIADPDAKINVEKWRRW